MCSDKKPPGRVLSPKSYLERIPLMSKHLLSIFLSGFVVGHLFAQAPQTAVADDYNSIFKTVKWRSIGPFRGGGPEFGTRVVGCSETHYIGSKGGGPW